MGPEQPLILLVDDDSQIRMLCHHILVHQGYRVLEADNGPDALSIARQDGAVHLLLTDVLMPGMNGVELARAIAAAQPGTPVLYMSGSDPETLRDLLGGDSMVLRKPFLPDALLQRVAEVLDGAASQESGRWELADDGQEQMAGELRAAVNQAHQEFLDACQVYTAKLEEFKLSGIPAPDGAQDVLNAGKARRAALQKYLHALRIFSEFASNKSATKISAAMRKETSA